MSTKNKILVLVGVALLSYAIGRYLQPAKVITKTETKIIEVEKEKVEYRTIVRYVKKSDGTEIKEEIKEEITENTNESKKESKELTIVENLKPQWKAGALLGTSSSTITDTTTVYGIQVERRILGPIFAGVWGTTSKVDNQTLGLSISMEF